MAAAIEQAGERDVMQRVRRQAAKDGESIQSFPPSSRWHRQYGPYAIADRENRLIAWGIKSVDDLAEQYDIAVKQAG